MFFFIYYIQTGYNSVYLNCWLFFQFFSAFTQLNVIKLDKHSCGSPLMLFNLWEGPLCHCITPALMAINKLIFWPMSVYQRLLHYYYMHHLHEGIGSHSLSIFILTFKYRWLHFSHLSCCLVNKPSTYKLTYWNLKAVSATLALYRTTFCRILKKIQHQLKRWYFWAHQYVSGWDVIYLT